MKSKIAIASLLSLVSLLGFSQQDSIYYLVLFNDKNSTPYSLQSPENFLSSKSIERRRKQGISLDMLDLPVDPSYVNQIKNIEGLRLRYTTKWLNGAVVSFNDPAILPIIQALPFATEPLALRSKTNINKELLPSIPDEKRVNIPMALESNIYGQSFPQIAMHRGHLMHEAGFTGKGVDIAVMDAGFNQTDVLPVFDHLRAKNLIKATVDFVDGDSELYHSSNHGTFVLSTIAGYMPDSLIGTSPDANYWLFRTENSSDENPIEECNWIAAAEFADSAGVDLFTTSLGYSQFDNSLLDYSPTDMDGSTALISRAAEIASSRGIVVLNSAGNKGSSEWEIITAPADARNILAVGAVEADSSHAFFSSYGPSADNRVKPDVAAMGLQSTYADLSGGVSRGNGTSFACPILAGLVANLIQAHPNMSARSIREAVIHSANRFYTPNTETGYGIPDLWEAHLMLNNSLSVAESQLQVLAYPNPFREELTLVVENMVKDDFRISLYDIQGREMNVPNGFLIEGNSLVRRLNLSFLSDGFYLLEIDSNGQRKVINLLKSSE